MRYVLCCLLCTPLLLRAQRSVSIQLPDAQITAAKVTRGDADTYGLGDWRCHFSIKLEGAWLKVEGKISFTENANDYTTIQGRYRQQMYVPELEGCRHCILKLSETDGGAQGANIGARGYRWFNGYGLVRRAYVQTDVFGEDAGHIGGSVQFVPIRVLVDCAMAANAER